LPAKTFPNRIKVMIKLYNTLSRKKEPFKPIRKQVSLYTCGPTVYDFAHIGNLRTYVFEDVLRRTLKYDGYRVKQVMNITDIDDKIIKRSQKEKKDIFKITQPLTKIFFDDLKKLNIEKAEVYPLATKHIKEIIKLIQILIKKGFAYTGKDKSIYFDIAKFKNYGRLSGLKKRELKIGARIEADEYNKNQAQDFVLWKSAKPNEHFWPSPYGNGRPGWHIECSAMAMKYLGGEPSQTIDIHAGAVDLIFPHHENEIAQSEAATDRKFVNYWVEGEHLLVDGKKMAKSSNNFYTLADIEDKNFNPLAFRYLVLISHYRSKLNFTWESLQAAQSALNNLYAFIQTTNDKQLTTNDDKQIKNYEKQFLAHINDDLNTPKAISVVWQIISASARGRCASGAKGGSLSVRQAGASGGKDNNLSSAAKKQLLLKFDKVLGLGLNNLKPQKTAEISREISLLVQKREILRVNKQFIQADGLRKKIEKLGFKIEDTALGPQIRKS